MPARIPVYQSASVPGRAVAVQPINADGLIRALDNWTARESDFQAEGEVRRAREAGLVGGSKQAGAGETLTLPKGDTDASEAFRFAARTAYVSGLENDLASHADELLQQHQADPEQYGAKAEAYLGKITKGLDETTSALLRQRGEHIFGTGMSKVAANRAKIEQDKGTQSVLDAVDRLRTEGLGHARGGAVILHQGARSDMESRLSSLVNAGWYDAGRAAEFLRLFDRDSVLESYKGEYDEEAAAGRGQAFVDRLRGEKDLPGLEPKERDLLLGHLDEQERLARQRARQDREERVKGAGQKLADEVAEALPDGSLKDQKAWVKTRLEELGLSDEDKPLVRDSAEARIERLATDKEQDRLRAQQEIDRTLNDAVTDALIRKDTREARNLLEQAGAASGTIRGSLLKQVEADENEAWQDAYVNADEEGRKTLRETAGLSAARQEFAGKWDDFEEKGEEPKMTDEGWQAWTQLEEAAAKDPERFVREFRPLAFRPMFSDAVYASSVRLLNQAQDQLRRDAEKAEYRTEREEDKKRVKEIEKADQAAKQQAALENWARSRMNDLAAKAFPGEANAGKRFYAQEEVMRHFNNGWVPKDADEVDREVSKLLLHLKMRGKKTATGYEKIGKLKDIPNDKILDIEERLSRRGVLVTEDLILEVWEQGKRKQKEGSGPDGL